MKQLFYIKDEALLVEGKSALYLIVGKRHFSFTIYKSNTNEIVCSAYYEMEERDDWKLRVLELHPELLINFEYVKIVYDLPEIAVIPTSLIDETILKLHLQTLYPINRYDILYADSIQNKEVKIGYSVSQELHNWINEIFPSAISSHLTVAFINSCTKTNTDSIFIDFRSGEFLVLVFKKEQLQLVQYYLFTNLADILYYLLKICEQLELSQDNVRIIISGLIEKDSAIYEELYKYFLNIEFEKSNKSVNFIDAFNEFPEYYFTSISKIITCAS